MVELFHALLTRVHDMTKPNFPRSFSFLFACFPNRESNSLSLFLSGRDLFKNISVAHIQKQNQLQSFPLRFTSDPVNFLKQLYSELFQPNSAIDISTWKPCRINVFQKQMPRKFYYREASPLYY